MLWICLGLLAIGLIAAISVGDAGTIGGFAAGDIAGVTAMLALLIFIGGSAISHYRGRLTGAARDLAIWLGLALVLVTGYTFREEAGFVTSRVAGELLPPGRPVTISSDTEGNHAVRLRKRSDGHFAARARVNGANISLLVDTGATTVMLTSRDARTVGLNLSNLRYTTEIQTANGRTKAAAVRLGAVEVGSIVVRNVEALVAQPGTLRESLLGMSFLRQLKSYEFSGEFLTLRS